MIVEVVAVVLPSPAAAAELTSYRDRDNRIQEQWHCPYVRHADPVARRAFPTALSGHALSQLLARTPDPGRLRRAATSRLSSSLDQVISPRQ